MPDLLTIDRDQRDGLYELVRNHLGSIEDFWVALERTRDYDTAQRLGAEFGDDFMPLRSIGWRPVEAREVYALTMPLQRERAYAHQWQSSGECLCSLPSFLRYYDPASTAQLLGDQSPISRVHDCLWVGQLGQVRRRPRFPGTTPCSSASTRP